MTAVINGATPAVGPTSKKSLLQQSVTCPQCHQFYQNPRHFPNCPHSLCHHCMLRLLKVCPDNGTQYAVNCPKCGKESRVDRESGVAGFQLNEELKQLAEMLAGEIGQHSDQQVQVANETNVNASSRCDHVFVEKQQCTHCSGRFCQSCQYIHCDQLRKELRLAKERWNGQEVDNESSADQILISRDEANQKNCNNLASRFDEQVKCVEGQLKGQAEELLKNLAMIIHKNVAEIMKQACSFREQQVARFRQAIDVDQPNLRASIDSIMTKANEDQVSDGLAKANMVDIAKVVVGAKTLDEILSEMRSKAADELVELIGFEHVDAAKMQELAARFAKDLCFGKLKFAENKTAAKINGKRVSFSDGEEDNSSSASSASDKPLPVSEAAKAKSPDSIIKVALDSPLPTADPTKSSTHLEKSLFEACFNGQIDHIRSLLQGGSDVAKLLKAKYSRQQHGLIGGRTWPANRNCLHFACANRDKRDQAQVVEVLLGFLRGQIAVIKVSKVLCRQDDSYECTALHYAALEGHHQSVRLICEFNKTLKNSSALLDLKSKFIGDGFTALMLAAFNGHFEAVEELARHGASVDIRNSDGKTALALAAQFGTNAEKRLKTMAALKKYAAIE